jgi:putative NIF3 family GTP cyclohydrolase 1 type 2
MKREELVRYLDESAGAARFKDYCPNGLQVEGRAECVASSPASPPARRCSRPRSSGADAMLVHHGWFWKGEDGRITAFASAHAASLLAHDINLFAYHLPLDAHPELGNNAQLAQRLGWTPTGVSASRT